MDWTISKIWAADKTAIGSALWVERDSTRAEASVVVAIRNVAIEGLTVRANAIVTMPDRGVCLNLLYHPAGAQCTPLARIDWNPFGTHTNPLKGPKSLRGKQLGCSHFHGFDVNFDEAKQEMRPKNLPFAEEVEPNPTSFAEMLQFAELKFGIKGLSTSLEAPPSRPGTLFDG